MTTRARSVIPAIFKRESTVRVGLRVLPRARLHRRVEGRPVSRSGRTQRRWRSTWTLGCSEQARHAAVDIRATAGGFAEPLSDAPHFRVENEPIGIEITVVLRETSGLFRPCSGPTREPSRPRKGRHSRARCSPWQLRRLFRRRPARKSPVPRERGDYGRLTRHFEPLCGRDSAADFHPLASEACRWQLFSSRAWREAC
jgi:hypothetical protein